MENDIQDASTSASAKEDPYLSETQIDAEPPPPPEPSTEKKI
jgi:hypothetical protein